MSQLQQAVQKPRVENAAGIHELEEIYADFLQHSQVERGVVQNESFLPVYGEEHFEILAGNEESVNAVRSTGDHQVWNLTVHDQVRFGVHCDETSAQHRARPPKIEINVGFPKRA